MFQRLIHSMQQICNCYFATIAYYERFDAIRNSLRQIINCYRYNRFATHVVKAKVLRGQLERGGYHSQYGQDKWLVEELLPGKKDGVFVDIGANDGITLSNTYILEKMGWNGLAIEPIPSVYKELIKNRQCTVINGCVASRSGKERFRVITGSPQMLSGLVNEYDFRHKKRIESELTANGGAYQEIEINCYNFNDLLESNGIFQVDFLSIDVEGVEYKILDSIDFNRFYISVICVENNYLDYKIPQLLIKRGFEFHSIVGDEFYLNRK
jgi:FkbM family methyltransferase